MSPKMVQSCSWCREGNEVRADGRKVFCWSCGHRADVARIDCDCPKCRRVAKPPQGILRASGEGRRA